MKKILLVLSIISLLLVSADTQADKLIRLTIVNKSGLDMEIKLTGMEDRDSFYFLRVPAGDRSNPTEKAFTILPGTYSMQADYVELWDPVYGDKCGSAGGKTLYAGRNIRVVFLECNSNISPRAKGEPTMMKWVHYWRCIY
jgi:hypothetical protein